MANIAYVRVSTVEQNEERQLAALKKINIDKIFSEKISARDTKRPQLQAMLEYIREGDTVYIHDFSRLARSTFDLLQLLEVFQNKGVKLVSLKENIDTGTPTGKLMLQMIAAINEFERENLLERQREGIKLAKERGAYSGRKQKKIDMDEFSRLYHLWKEHKITKSGIADKLDVSRTVIYRLFKDVEN